MRNSAKDLNVVNALMKEAEKYNMQYEVILYALYNMKENPELTIEEALNAGLTEWDI